jgi:hypothetical protein
VDIDWLLWFEHTILGQHNSDKFDSLRVLVRKNYVPMVALRLSYHAYMDYILVPPYSLGLFYSLL